MTRLVLALALTVGLASGCRNGTRYPTVEREARPQKARPGTVIRLGTASTDLCLGSWTYLQHKQDGRWTTVGALERDERGRLALSPAGHLSLMMCDRPPKDESFRPTADLKPGQYRITRPAGRNAPTRTILWVAKFSITN